MAVSLQLAAEKKMPFLVQLKQIFGPSYFDRALVGTVPAYYIVVHITNYLLLLLRLRTAVVGNLIDT